MVVKDVIYMGKVISAWSATKKTGKTVLLYMLISNLIKQIDNKTKVLVCCSNLNYGNLLNLFEISGDELNIEDIVNYKISPDNKFNMTKALAQRDNIYFLGSKKTSMAYVSRNIKEYEKLVEDFRQTFDLVIFDTISGHENILTNMLLDKSDYIINVISQDKEILDTTDFITSKELAFVVNSYKDIYPDIGELKSLYKINNVFEVPDCKELQQMKNRGQLAYYPQYETEYNKAINDVSEFIAKKLKLVITSTHPVKKSIQQGFLDLIRRGTHDWFK